MRTVRLVTLSLGTFLTAAMLIMTALNARPPDASERSKDKAEKLIMPDKRGGFTASLPVGIEITHEFIMNRRGDPQCFYGELKIAMKEGLITITEKRMDRDVLVGKIESNKGARYEAGTGACKLVLELRRQVQEERENTPSPQ